MENLEKLQGIIPTHLHIQLTRLINYEPFRNMEKKIAQLKYFSKVSLRIIKYLKNQLEAGISEKQIEDKIKQLGRKFHLLVIPLLVSSGENTAKIHGYATERKIQKRDIIMIDIGLKRHLFSNCTSDITRTFFRGEPSESQQKIYAIVEKAHDMAVEAVKPGVNPYSIDKMVRDYFRKFHFVMPHGLGHGTGTRYPHNLPMLSNNYTNFRLKENDIITIEPGIYLPGEFGVRIEDMVLVTRDGYEMLSTE